VFVFHGLFSIGVWSWFLGFYRAGKGSWDFLSYRQTYLEDQK
jgi:hypothetical protein